MHIGNDEEHDTTRIFVRFDCVFPPTEPLAVEMMTATVTGPDGKTLAKGVLGEEHYIEVPMTPESYPYSVAFSFENEE